MFEGNTEKDLLFNGSNWFDENFYAFLFDKESKYKKIKESFLEKKNTVSGSSHTYRTINSWDSAGLLLKNQDRESGWRRFSLIDLLWLSIVQELRTVGFSIEKIKKVKEGLFSTHFLEKGQDESIALLEFYLFVYLYAKKEVVVIVTSEGRVGITRMEEYLNYRVFEGLSSSVIIIDFGKIYNKIVSGKNVQEMKTPLIPFEGKLSDILMSLATDEGLKEINIQPKNGTIGKISYKTSKINPENTLNELREIIKEGGRKEVTIKMQDGKVTFIERTNKT